MTEREYQRMLDAVDEAINADAAFAAPRGFDDVPAAANDNQSEWPCLPFPDGWTASP